jgi:hypothetical protein
MKVNTDCTENTYREKMELSWLRFAIFILALVMSGACTEFKSSSSSSTGSATTTGSFLPTWSFLSYPTIESILKVQLGLDEAIAQDALIFSYLRAHQSELGVGNFSLGMPDNIRAEPIKFRYLTEVISDACYLGLQKQRVYDSLFPSVGAQNNWSERSFDIIYLKALGRRPSAAETTTLLELVNSMSSMGVSPSHLKKSAAVCSVVFSSIEAANSR